MIRVCNICNHFMEITEGICIMEKLNHHLRFQEAEFEENGGKFHLFRTKKKTEEANNGWTIDGVIVPFRS